MNSGLCSLSAIEAAALVRIKLSAKLDSQLRSATHRLIHLGIVGEDPNWMRECVEAACRILDEDVQRDTM
jgi:hypothetical protein